MSARHLPSGSRRSGTACLVLLALLGCTEAGPPKPDLVLVTVDTLRADRLACYGARPDVGSALCRIGDAGTRYLWAVSPAPSTAPAIASIMTSRYPSQHGVTQFATTSLAGDLSTLTEVLADAGYATAAFVANPVLTEARNLDQGFDVYDDEMKRREGNRAGVVERTAEEVTDAALAWVESARSPFFVWVHFQDPHGPYAPPGAPPAYPLPGKRLPALEDQSGRNGVPAYQQLRGVSSVASYEARYLDEIRYLDRQLSRLIIGLDSQGERPGILLTADHGEAFGEDDHWFAHGHSLGLDQIRVPLLWRPPGAGAAATVTTPVSTIDVGPTLLAAAGIPRPEEFQGRVLPTAEGDPGADSSPRRIFAEHRMRVAIVEGREYYARDRRFMEKPVRDRITGGWLQPLPPRTAHLAADGEASPYQALSASAPTSEVLPQEIPLQEFLMSTPERAVPESVELSTQTREAMRALGYLE